MISMMALLACAMFQDGPPPADAKAQVRERLIKRFDADKDGRLSGDELRAARQALSPEAVDLSDKAVSPALLESLYGAKAGPHEVATLVDLKIARPEGGDALSVRASFPKTGGPFPVIVHSHGALGSKDGYLPLTVHWASHGYVVLQPTHGDSLSLRSEEERAKAEDVAALLNDPATLKHWSTRPKDVALVLDALAGVPELKGKADESKVGMSGHSYGAHTCQMVAGMTLSGPGGRRSELSDPRPKAFLAISPQGTGGAIDKGSWAKATRPMMVVTGTNDTSLMHPGRPASWRLEAFENLPAGEKALVFLEGATHNFGGISGSFFPGAGPPLPDQVAIVRSVSTAHWDAHLKDDPKARAFLAGRALEEATKGGATIKRK